MIAIDTNLLVRILTNDDPIQARRAAKILQSDDVFIPKTVILETQWVLHYAYAINKADIISGFQKLLGLPNVYPENSETVTQAISWYEQGLDFADALHLASSRGSDKFATFDAAFERKARKVSSLQIIKV
jgi:predicted nucleic-acid-binding protein